jgi:hypothetical protein
MQLGAVGGAGTACPDGCFVNSTINIPAINDCYSHYSIEIKSDIKPGSSVPITALAPGQNYQDILSSLPACIDVDERLSVYIKLYRHQYDKDPCLLSQTVRGCEIDCCEKFQIAVEANTGTCDFRVRVETLDWGLCDLSTFEIRTFTTMDGTNWSRAFDTQAVPITQSDLKKIGVEIWIDGQRCGDMRIFDVECDCDACPPMKIKDKMIQLDIIQDDPGCGPGMCKPVVNINDFYTDRGCYTNYKISANRYDKHGVTLETFTNGSSGEALPSSSGATRTLNDGELPCLNPGEKLSVKVEMYRTSDQSDEPCVLISEVEACPLIDLNRDNICEQDTEIPNSGGLRTVEFTMPNGCKYLVTYEYYKTTDNFQDVKLLDAQPIDGNCSGTNNLADILRDAVPAAIADILKVDERYEPGRDSDIICYDLWRVVQSSCWSEWELTDLNTLETWERFLPCESSCCGRKLRVCKYSDNDIRVTDLGFAFGSSSYNCSQDALVPSGSHLTIDAFAITDNPQSCFDKDCDIFEDLDKWYEDRNNDLEDRVIDHELREVIPDPNPYAKEGDYQKESSELFIYKVEVTNDYLLIKTKESDVESLRFEVVDLSGKLVYKEDLNINGIVVDYYYETSDLITGTYIYRIYSRNNTSAFKTGSFQIKR